MIILNTQTGLVVGGLVVQKHTSLEEVFKSLKAAVAASAPEDLEEGEDPPMVDEGVAWTVVSAILAEVAKGPGGEAAAKEMYSGAVAKSGSSATDFLALVCVWAVLCGRGVYALVGSLWLVRPSHTRSLLFIYTLVLIHSLSVRMTRRWARRLPRLGSSGCSSVHHTHTACAHSIPLVHHSPLESVCCRLPCCVRQGPACVWRPPLCEMNT